MIIPFTNGSGHRAPVTYWVVMLLVAATTMKATAENVDLRVTIDADGVTHIPAMTVPYSALASDESKRAFLKATSGDTEFAAASKNCKDITCERKVLDDVFMKPGVQRLRAAFAVTVTPERIGGVQTDVIEPEGGVAEKNRRRVLINLHGGGMQFGARFGGQQESIPIASLGNFKVVTVDYRMAPEHTFPAASEDVAAVYRELLRNYRPENIGVYGCSAGGYLAGQAVAWFQTHGLPRPGAVGFFGAGMADRRGDSAYVASPLMGGGIADRKELEAINPYLKGADSNDPMVYALKSPAIFKRFPPILFMTGTRDIALSDTVYTHAQLDKAGVETELHVWEAAPHCSFAQPVLDPTPPETREAWDVIIRFFDKHLGR